jgi:hypothetical protein
MFNNLESKYMLMKITNSKDTHRKYDAHITNTENGKTHIVPFGNIDKRHYRDSTSLGTYKHLDHWDLKKRDDYINENKKKFEGNKNKFSSDYFTAKFLYSIRI